MKERIRELALQASGDSHYLHTHGEPLQKFAKLLVRECSDLFEIEYGQSEVSGNEVARVLKKHFGVES